MLSTLVAPRGRAGLAAAAGALLLAIGAPAAHAAKVNVTFDVSVYPAGYDWDGRGTAPTSPSTGSWYVDYNVRAIDGAQHIPYRTEQLRGGAVIQSSDVYNGTPTSVVPGDVFRAVRRDNGGLLAETSYTGQPAITSSVFGQPNFAGTYTPGANEISVSLQRRLPRNVTSSYGNSQPYSTNAFETISRGRITSLGDSTFGGAFATPINAGDVVTVSQFTQKYENDIATSTWFSVTAPGGVVPPKDAVPPKITRVLFGVKSLDVAAFRKSGLNTFVTLDEPGTITQTVTEDTSKGKGKKSALTKPKSKKKKPKTKAPKTPTVIAEAKGKSSAAGETVPLTLVATKKGKSLLKSAEKKGIKLLVTTTATDLAGNTTTSTLPYKLTAPKKAKKK